MTIPGTYHWAISHYANWRTAASIGAVILLIAAATTISYLTRNRSS
jgi:hypothetical protein